MIRLTRLSGEELVVNAELIETAEATPDTVVTLTTGRKVVVRESLDELIELVVAYRRAAAAERLAARAGEGAPTPTGGVGRAAVGSGGGGER